MKTGTLETPQDTGRDTRVLVFTNGSAGSGKSTTAAALAFAAAKAGKEVCFIGLDKQRDGSRLLGYDDPDGDENLPTLFDVVDKLVTLPEAVVPALNNSTKEPIPHLWVVLESKQLESLEFKLAGETARELWLQRIIGELRGRFDIIALDCSGDVKLGTIAAIIAGDEVVGCTKSQEKEARGLTELEDKIAEVAEVYGHTGMPTGIDWVVITEGVKDKSQGKVYKDMENQLREAYGKIVVETVRSDVKVPEAYTAGQPVTLYSPAAPASLTYTKIGQRMKLYR